MTKYKYSRKEIYHEWMDNKLPAGMVIDKLLTEKTLSKQDKPVCEHKNLKRIMGAECKNVGICQDCGVICVMPSSKEIKPIDWLTKTWDKHMLRKYNKKVDKLIARIVRETQRIEGEMVDDTVKEIKLPVNSKRVEPIVLPKIGMSNPNKSNKNIFVLASKLNEVISHITALEERE